MRYHGEIGERLLKDYGETLENLGRQFISSFFLIKILGAKNFMNLRIGVMSETMIL